MTSKLEVSSIFLFCLNICILSQLMDFLFLFSSYLKSSVIPADTVAIIRVLAMLPSFQVEEMIINKAAAVLPQCRLHHLNCIATAFVKWHHHGQLHWQNSSEQCAKLLQKLNDCGFQRLQKANNLDLLLEELPYVNGEWFEEVLNEETLAMCQHLIDQITWENVLPLSFFLIKSEHRCPVLFDRIASVTVENIDKVSLFFFLSTVSYSVRKDMLVADVFQSTIHTCF